MVAPRKQGFWQNAKGNHCIILMQKLVMILETKFFKNGSYQKIFD
jgi:hypothetical protein